MVPETALQLWGGTRKPCSHSQQLPQQLEVPVSLVLPTTVFFLSNANSLSFSFSLSGGELQEKERNRIVLVLLSKKEAAEHFKEPVPEAEVDNFQGIPKGDHQKEQEGEVEKP